jgi:hypothetical protein
MNKGVLICFTSFCGKKHMPAGILEVQEDGKFMAEPCVIATSLKKAAAWSSPAMSSL